MSNQTTDPFNELLVINDTLAQCCEKWKQSHETLLKVAQERRELLEQLTTFSEKMVRERDEWKKLAKFFLDCLDESVHLLGPDGLHIVSKVKNALIPNPPSSGCANRFRDQGFN